MGSRDGPLLVERVLSAPADEVFEVLVTPTRHPDPDRTTVRRRLRAGPTRLSPGAVFTERRRWLGIDYDCVNEVLEFEEARRLAWRSHAELLGHRLAGGVVWRYLLSGRDGTTVVRHEHAWEDSDIAWLLRLGGYPARALLGMSRTLQELDRSVTGERGPPGAQPRW